MWQSNPHAFTAVKTGYANDKKMGGGVYSLSLFFCRLIHSCYDGWLFVGRGTGMRLKACITVENLMAAESRISDTDFPTEMTDFVRNQILTQSATAMLAQANSMPQMCMQLFQG